MPTKTPEKGDTLTYRGTVSKKPAANAKTVRITAAPRDNRGYVRDYITVPASLLRMVERAPASKGDTVINPVDKSELVVMTNAAGGCVLAQSKDPSVGITMLKPEHKWSTWEIKSRVSGSFIPGDVVEFDVTYGSTNFPSNGRSVEFGYFIPDEKIVTRGYFSDIESVASLEISKATKISSHPHALGDTIIDPHTKANVMILTNPAAGCVLGQSTDPSVGVIMLKPEHKWTSWERVN